MFYFSVDKKNDCFNLESILIFCYMWVLRVVSLVLKMKLRESPLQSKVLGLSIM